VHVQSRLQPERPGAPLAITPDGLPCNEHWRGTAVNAYESGIIDELAADAIDRALRRPE
jgi:hypothetical protein